MQQSKQISQNRDEKPHPNRIYLILLLIFIPVVYLVYRNYYVPNVSEKVEMNAALDTTTTTANRGKQESLQKAIDLAESQPNENNFINLSLEYYYNGKYKECATAAENALKYNAQSYAAYNNLCSAYNMLGYWDDAIVAGKKALEIRPGDQLAANNLKASTDGKALQDKKISEALSLATASPSEANYLSLGTIYYSARKFELAIAAYKKALSYNSKNVVTYNNICSAYNELGKWSDAAENCQKALAIDSTFMLAKNNLKVAQENLK